MSSNYTLDYAPSAVQHLGVGLYKQLPQALAELITNCWDADATKVTVMINYREKLISIDDNGIGMTHEELNKNFLKVAKNRRLTEKTGLSLKGRKVTGKKGLGKLALFGIADRIQIYSTKNGFENAFEMNFKVIQNTPEDEKYHPRTIKDNEPIKTEKHGTKIIINDLTLKNITELETLSNSLARRFDKYSSDEFLVILKDEKGNSQRLDENSFEKSIRPSNVEFTYVFPDDFQNEIQENTVLRELIDNHITGKIFTGKTPLRASNQGYCVLSRGKLASNQSIRQFDDRANDRFNQYSTGYFDIDFIDDNLSNDYISTDRQAILWDATDDLVMLRENLNKLMRIVQKKWRLDREHIKTAQIEKTIKDTNTLKTIMDSPNLSSADKDLINKTADIIEKTDVEISKTDKKNLLDTVARNTDAYRKDNSVYKELIPRNFIVPQSIASKIRRLREEANNIVTDKDTPDKFILTHGLLLRALIDSTTSTLLIKNSDEFHSLGILDVHVSTHKKIYELKLKDKISMSVRFLEKKEYLMNKKSATVINNQIGNMRLTGQLDQLMHDPEQWPKFDDIKNMWDIMAPILMASFELIKD
ncbi:ATP-binding protein [Latilactobacillus sakei]